MKLAAANELQRGEAPRMLERIAEIQREIAAMRRANIVLDKAFFDGLCGDED